MNKNVNSEIQEAFLIYEKEQLKAFDSLESPPINHTDEFQSKIEKIKEYIKKASSKLNIKKIVIGALVAVLLASIITACAFRKPILDFFEKVFDDHIELDGNNPDGTQIILEKYLPTYIPQGYIKTREVDDIVSFYKVWENGDDIIVYEQTPLSVTNINIHSDNYQYEILNLGEQIFYYTNSGHDYAFITENDDYVFTLNCSDSIPQEEINKMLLSIKVVEEDKNQ